MTKQEIYNKVARHLLRQNKRAENDEGCLYRAGKLRCAVGCLIPNRLYSKEIETGSVHVPSSVVECNHAPTAALNKVLREIGIRDNQRHFLEALQSCHDDNEPEEWRDKLAEIAQEYNLKQVAP